MKNKKNYIIICDAFGIWMIVRKQSFKMIAEFKSKELAMDYYNSPKIFKQNN